MLEIPVQIQLGPGWFFLIMNFQFEFLSYFVTFHSPLLFDPHRRLQFKPMRPESRGKTIRSYPEVPYALAYSISD